MFSLSYLVATLSALALFALGWFVNNFRQKKSTDWKVNFDKLDKEHQAQTKQLNKHQKMVEQLKQKSESWKLEYQSSAQKIQELNKEHSSQALSIKEEEKTLRAELQNLKTEKDRAVTNLERIQKDNEKLREKYKRDVADGKEWRSERQTLERELKSTSEKLNRSSQIAEEYKGKYAEGRRDQQGQSDGKRNPYAEDQD